MSYWCLVIRKMRCLTEHMFYVLYVIKTENHFTLHETSQFSKIQIQKYNYSMITSDMSIHNNSMITLDMNIHICSRLHSKHAIATFSSSLLITTVDCGDHQEISCLQYSILNVVTKFSAKNAYFLHPLEQTRPELYDLQLR